MSEQNEQKTPRKPPHVEESPSWRFPKITQQMLKDPKDSEKHRRIPEFIWGGRLRTSTLVLIIAFLVLSATKKPLPSSATNQPWAPPTNAVFGTDGNWTVPAQVPTTRYRAPQNTYPTSTSRSEPSTSESGSTTPSTSESGSTTPSTSESGETSDESTPSRSHRSGESSSSSSSATTGSSPSSSAAPTTERSRAIAPESPRQSNARPPANSAATACRPSPATAWTPGR